MSNDTITAYNVGVYPEHPTRGKIAFAANGALFFGGARYVREDGVLARPLEDRVAALEDRADVFNQATSITLQNAATAKGTADAAITLITETNRAVTALEGRIVELETAAPTPSGPEADVENVPRPRFSQGDRVVYIAPAKFGSAAGTDVASRPDGTLGIVLEDSNGAAGVRVQWEGADRPTMTSIQFVQPAPPTTKYAVGDVVEIGGSIYGSVEPGTWGIVRGVGGTDGRVVYSVKVPRRSFLFNEAEIRGKVS